MLGKIRKGFTLIELLVVVGILALLLAVVIIAVNPSEQLSKANDVSVKTVAKDFVQAGISFYAEKNELPWDSDPACQVEIAAGETLADMPSCTHALISGGKLEEEYNASSALKDIHLKKCGKSAVLCYIPKSKQEYESAETKYDKFGVNQPGCPGKKGSGPECYWCRPIMNDPQCLISPTPLPTNAPTVTPSPTPTLVPIATTTPTNTPTTTPTQSYLIPGYALDDTKFFQTYAVLSFTDPGFPPNRMVDISMRPDFGGTTSKGFGYFVNGVPVTSNSEQRFPPLSRQTKGRA